MHNIGLKLKTNDSILRLTQNNTMLIKKDLMLFSNFPFAFKYFYAP